MPPDLNDDYAAAVRCAFEIYVVVALSHERAAGDKAWTRDEMMRVQRFAKRHSLKIAESGVHITIATMSRGAKKI